MQARYNKLDLEYGTGIIWSLETAFRRFKIFHKTTARSCHRNVKVVESRPEMLRHPAIKPIVHCSRSACAACMIVTYLLQSVQKWFLPTPGSISTSFKGGYIEEMA